MTKRYKALFFKKMQTRRRWFFTSICCCGLAGAVQAQTVFLPERQTDPLSPSEKRYQTVGEEMDARQQRVLYANPVYCEWLHTADSLFLPVRYHSSVYTGVAHGELDGDFLPYEGNAFNDYRLGASGEYAVRWGGTLYGMAQYSRGEHKNIGWSAVRYPELYTPYISTDSIGGDFKYEDYLIRGGYAFTLGKWKLGVSGLFHGEQAHRKTDPRALNNTTWLNVGAGVSRMFGGHLLMADGSFGRNKQHVDLRYWRPGEQDRFFVCYGFGLYDVRQSGVAFGYSRMYYIKEGSARLTYQSPQHRRFSAYASVGYEYDRMKTEESNICDLYFSKTHSVLPSVRLDWKPASSWLISLWMDGRIDLRKGSENIFDRYLSDPDNNIYDYRLIDTQQKYSQNQGSGLGQLRVRYQFHPQHAIALTGGTSVSWRQEKYKMDGYKVQQAALFPHGKVNYQMNVKNSELDLSVLYGKKVNLDNTYEVRLKNQSIEHLDFQQCFAPYAYHNSTYSSLQLDASYVYHFKKYALGLNVKWMYKKGDRDPDAVYRYRVGFASSAPMISTTPDKHDESWGSSTLFLVF